MNHVVVDPVKMDLYAFVLKDACDEFFEVDVAERILRPIFLTPGKGAAACATGGMDVRAAAELFVCEEDRAGFLALFSRQSLDEVCAIKSENRGNSGGCSREDVNAGSGEPFFHVMPAAGIRPCFILWILKAGMRPGLCR